MLAQAVDAEEIDEDEDEAVSLATAILVGGAHAVRYNGANWSACSSLTRAPGQAARGAGPAPAAVDKLLRHIPRRNGVGLPRMAMEDGEAGRSRPEPARRT